LFKIFFDKDTGGYSWIL